MRIDPSANLERHRQRVRIGFFGYIWNLFDNMVMRLISIGVVIGVIYMGRGIIFKWWNLLIEAIDGRFY